MIMRCALATLAALCLTTCCPTVWVQVHKDNPAPWPAVERPAIADPPLVMPSAVPNRFDVFHGGARTVDVAEYTDRFDPRNDVPTARARAQDALSLILERYKSAMPCTRITARVVCMHQGGSGLSANCHTLEVPRLGAAPAAVQVRGKRYAVTVPHDASLGPGAPDAPLTSAVTELELSGRIDATDGERLEVCIEDDPELSRTLLSFVHLSDIQIRDPSITLTDRRLSRQLDWFEPLSSFEYDEDLAFYNQYVVEAIVATINRIVDHFAEGSPDGPAFVIHTGDAIDVGAMSELDRFHQLIDRLDIPFLEIFGNHDTLVFGNLTPTDTHDTDRQCTPIAALLGGSSPLLPNKLCVDQLVRCPTCIGNEAELVATTTHEATRQRFMARLTHSRNDLIAQPDPVARDSELYCAAPVVRHEPYSRAHGFDLGTADGRTDGRKLGYYAFAQPLDGTDRHAVFIALDSEDLEDHHGGIRGRLGHAQVTWLEAVLACVKNQHPRDLVFVLAHQALSEIDVAPVDLDRVAPGRTVARILEASPNVVGYLYGHDHDHGLCRDRREGVCATFWEVQTGSLIEFPQEGRLVRIKQAGDNLAFLELTGLRERLADQTSDLARYVQLARRGAERDRCRTRHGSARCSDDLRPYRVDGRDTNARLFFPLP